MRGWSTPSSTSCARGVRGTRCPPTGPLEHRLPRVRRPARRMRLRAHKPGPGDDGSPARGARCKPSAAVLDSQIVKTTEAGGPRGYDAAKKIGGCKRHAWSIPMARPPGRAAPGRRAGPRRWHSLASRLGADLPLRGTRLRRRRLWHRPARRRLLRHAAGRALDRGSGRFVVLPRRWVVERFFAWIGRNRRFA